MNKSRISIFIIRLIIISLSAALIYQFLFRIISLPNNFTSYTILIILAFCVADYFEYYFVQKKIFPNSKNSYSTLAEMIQQSLVIQKIHNLRPFLIVMLFFGVYLILGTISLGIVSSITGEEITDIGSGETIVSLFLIGIIFAPLLETLLFQMIPIVLLRRITPPINGKRNHIFPCLVSAILFSLAHNYSISYAMLAFCMGLCLSSVYALVSAQTGRTWKDGFLWTMTFHMTKNGLSLLLAILE